MIEDAAPPRPPAQVFVPPPSYRRPNPRGFDGKLISDACYRQSDHAVCIYEDDCGCHCHL
jgi:hypothetical protein